jgi:syntaxin 1B/2/3
MASRDRLAELRGERKGVGTPAERQILLAISAGCGGRRWWLTVVLACSLRSHQLGTEIAPLVDVPLTTPSLAPMSRYTTLHAHIASLGSITSQFDDLSQAEKAAASVKKRKEVAAHLQKSMDEASLLIRKGKKELDDAERENQGYFAEHGEAAATSQIRTNLHHKAAQDFAAAVQTYRAALNKFQSDLRARSAREVKLVDPTLDEQKVEQLVDSGSASQFVQAKLLDEPSEHLKSTVSSIEGRFLEIRALERSVLEIAELFQDMHVLVSLQQDSLDIVERHIVKAKNHAERGEVDIQKASKWQDKARKASHATTAAREL